jgi:hypothetical protein
LTGDFPEVGAAATDSFGFSCLGFLISLFPRLLLPLLIGYPLIGNGPHGRKFASLQLRCCSGAHAFTSGTGGTGVQIVAMFDQGRHRNTRCCDARIRAETLFLKIYRDIKFIIRQEYE